MLDLKLLLLLNLLSFSLQDKNCLVKFEYCIPNSGDSVPETEYKSDIDHSLNGYGEECSTCEDGYALSYDMK